MKGYERKRARDERKQSKNEYRNTNTFQSGQLKLDLLKDDMVANP